MSEIFMRAVVLFGMSTAGCVAAGPWVVRRLASAQMVQPGRHADCPPLETLQVAKRGTPTMGGVLVLGAAGVVALLGGGLSDPRGWVVVLSIGLAAGLGGLDDYLKLRGINGLGVRSLPKLAAALAIGLLVGGAMVGGPGRPPVRELAWLGSGVAADVATVLFAMFVVAGSMHAVNLTDGMDGLAGGCLAIALGALGLWGLQHPFVPAALVAWCAALAGACAGFLWMNAHPAAVFMGDLGALALGAALGTLSLLMGVALWLPLLGAVFVAETLSVMVQVASYKWRQGRRVFRVAPLHHHFQVGGMPESRVVTRFWIAGGLCATGTLALMGWAGWP